MEFMLLPLISYLAAAAYLMAWIIRQSWSLQRKFRSWWRQRQAVGKILSLRSLKKSNHRPDIWLSLVGAALGVLTAPWSVTWVSREWQLLILVASAILIEEFRPSGAALNLLAVAVLLDRLRVYNQSESDLFEVLSKIVQDLPEGELEKVLRETLHRRRSGLPAEACLAILREINSYLDEFILTLRHMNWQTGPALTQVAERLYLRTARSWDRNSRWMRLKERVWPYLSFAKAVVISSTMTLFIQGIATQSTAWPSRITVVLLLLALLTAGLCFHLILTEKWPRRVVVAALLLFALFPAVRTIQIPVWIQIYTITDTSVHFPDSIIETHLEELWSH